MRENAFDKARRLLAEARVSVLQADARHIEARVRGDSAQLYRTGYQGDWHCSCLHMAKTTRCSHVLALQLVWLQPEDRP